MRRNTYNRNRLCLYCTLWIAQPMQQKKGGEGRDMMVNITSISMKNENNNNKRDMQTMLVLVPMTGIEVVTSPKLNFLRIVLFNSIV